MNQVPRPNPSNWDLVLIGCGTDQRETPCRAIDLYKGHLFTDNHKIVRHLGHPNPSILSTRHGILAAHHKIEPYNVKFGKKAPQSWNDDVLRSLMDFAARSGLRRPPVVLVLAGAAFIEGWATRARQAGMVVDDPLQGLVSGARRSFASRFTTETPPRNNEESPSDHTRTPRGQLLDFVAKFTNKKTDYVVQQPINRWWLRDPRERFWIEVTDREIVGENLLAPLTDRAGKSNWRYSLITETRPGDVVYHFNKRVRAIVGRSQVAGGSESATLTWVARGTYARRDGAIAEEREAVKVPLRGFVSLQPVISRALLQQRRAEMAAIQSKLRSEHGKSVYFPFFVSQQRGGDPNQGYFFKMPVDLVRLLGLDDGGGLLTDDREELETAIQRLRGSRLQPPLGQLQPKRSERRAAVFYRDPAVAAYVLQEANGICELCQSPAPFLDAAGEPFLEVHHVKTLARQGSDTPTNAVALCPNCHRACHLAKDRVLLIERLFAAVARLVRE